MDTNENYRVSGFLPNSDNLCGVNTLRRTVRFGVNMTTTCNVKVHVDDFKCSCLRKIVFNRLNAYFSPSDYVSKNGNVKSYSDLGIEWLKIARQDANNIIYGTTENLTNVILTKNCTNIPSGINVWFLYAEVGKSRGQPTNEILATYVR
jgi:hypothetical protein